MEPHLKKIAALLGEDESGPFFGESEIVYVDLVLGGTVGFYKEGWGEVLEEVMRLSGREEVCTGGN
jgi:hypothetical protein